LKNQIIFARIVEIKLQYNDRFRRIHKANRAR